MSVRRNNLSGHDQRNMSHGVWYKRKSYKNQGFRQVPNLSIEERQEELNKKLKPYSLDLAKHIPLEASYSPSEVGPGPEPVLEYQWIGAGGTASQMTWTSEDNMSTITERTNVPSSIWEYITYSPSLDIDVMGRAYSTSYNTSDFVYSTDDGVTWTSTAGNTANERPRFGAWAEDLGFFFWQAYFVNKMLKSTDGINWTKNNSATGNQTDWIEYFPEYSLFVSFRQGSTLQYYTADGITETLCSVTQTGGSFGPGNYPGGILKNSSGDYYYIKHNRSDLATVETTTNGQDWFYETNTYTTSTSIRPNTRCCYVNADGHMVYNTDRASFDGFRSTDDGVTWEAFSITDNTTNGMLTKQQAIDPVTGIVYGACINNGIVKSTDGGYTWEDHINIAGGARSISVRVK